MEGGTRGGRAPVDGNPPNAARPFPHRAVRWTLPLAGLLLYTVVFTSVRLPLGDVAMGVALLGMLLVPNEMRFPVPVRTLAVFLVWVMAASVQSQYPEWFSARVMDLVKLWLIALVAYNALRSRAQIRLFMICFLACFALWPVRGTIITFFAYREFDVEGRAAWIQLYSNPNDLANMALLQLSMAGGLLVTERKGWLRACALAGLVVLPLVILLTQSRGVFIGLVAFLAIIFTGQRRRLQLAVRLFALTLVLVAVAPSGVWGRMESLKRATDRAQLSKVDGEKGSARERYEIWKVATRIIADHPVTGVGFNAYKPAHFDYAQRLGVDEGIRGLWDTHSLYLNVTAETGFPGLLLYLTYFATVLIPTERIRRRCKRELPAEARQLLILEAGLMGFMTACVFGSLAYLPHLHLHLVLVYALAMVYRDELRGSTPAVVKESRMRRFEATSPRPAGRLA